MILLAGTAPTKSAYALKKMDGRSTRIKICGVNVEGRNLLFARQKANIEAGKQDMVYMVDAEGEDYGELGGTGSHKLDEVLMMANVRRRQQLERNDQMQKSAMVAEKAEISSMGHKQVKPVMGDFQARSRTPKNKNRKMRVSEGTEFDEKGQRGRIGAGHG